MNEELAKALAHAFELGVRGPYQSAVVAVATVAHYWGRLAGERA